MLVASPFLDYDKVMSHSGPPRIISEIPKNPDVRQTKEVIRPKISGDLLVICTNERRWWPRRVIIRGGQLLVGSAPCEGASPSLRIPLRHLSLRAGPLPNSLSLIKGTTIVLTIQTSSQRTFDLWVKTIAIELIKQTPLDAVKYLDILTLKDCWNRTYDENELIDHNYNSKTSKDFCNSCQRDGESKTSHENCQNIEEYKDKTLNKDIVTSSNNVQPTNNVSNKEYCEEQSNVDVKTSSKEPDDVDQIDGISKDEVDCNIDKENKPKNNLDISGNENKSFERGANGHKVNGSFRRKCEEFQKIIESQQIFDVPDKVSPKKIDYIKGGSLQRYTKDSHILRTSAQLKCIRCNENKVMYDINRNTIEKNEVLDLEVDVSQKENGGDVIHTVEILFKKCQNTENYVPVREKLVLFESLSRLGRVRSTEDVSLKVNVATKRARSLHDLTNCFVSTGVREICKYFETKTEDENKFGVVETKKRMIDSDSQLDKHTIRFSRNLHNVSYA